MFSPLINSDPELKEHWSRLTKSCAEAATASNEDEFQHSLQETLKTISDKAQAVVGEENNLSEEELARIWSNLGIGADDEENGSNNFANLMPLMTNMMQNLLSKELLYPALNELAEKYPTFLNENKDKLSAEELKRYTKQMELMKMVSKYFKLKFITSKNINGFIKPFIFKVFDFKNNI
ncbi:peroxisomal biogenesis factor 19-like [Oppia nitens]|uniref:peroxisomal biogenesis factor 19-like n=1 Tax=Oppia nitens TaxID=1686743 RepID=UPI0023DBBF19|nr:peroxisomal biogenesis factor 19-like [Oppia nitens]